MSQFNRCLTHPLLQGLERLIDACKGVEPTLLLVKVKFRVLYKNNPKKSIHLNAFDVAWLKIVQIHFV